MSKITKSAQGKQCTIRLPGYCNGNSETTVWAHLNSVRWGSGKGIKSPDICGAYACSSCHDIVDGRRRTDLDRDFIRMYAMEGHMESLMILWEEGIIE